jgi:hypothetical protein
MVTAFLCDIVLEERLPQCLWDQMIELLVVLRNLKGSFPSNVKTLVDDVYDKAALDCERFR